MKTDTIIFELWRQDDNGNLFRVGTFPDRPSAERRLAELTRSQHKQMYWITESGKDSIRETTQCR